MIVLTLFQLSNFGFRPVFIVLFAYFFFAGFSFLVLSCPPGFPATLIVCLFVLHKALCIFIPRNFSSGGFTQHGKYQLQVVHVVTQVIRGFGKALHILIGSRSKPKSRFANLSSEYTVFLAFLYTPFFPLPGKLIPDRELRRSFVPRSFSFVTFASLRYL